MKRDVVAAADKRVNIACDGAVAAPHERRAGLLDACGGNFMIGRPATASVRRLDWRC